MVNILIRSLKVQQRRPIGDGSGSIVISTSLTQIKEGFCADSIQLLMLYWIYFEWYM